SGRPGAEGSLSPHLAGAWLASAGPWNVQFEGEWNGPAFSRSGVGGDIAKELRLSAARSLGGARMHAEVWAKDNRDSGVFQQEWGGRIDLAHAARGPVRLVASAWSVRRISATSFDRVYESASTGIETSL